jgi:hypothetical protein
MRRGRLVMGLIMALIAFASYYGYREVNPITGEKQHIGMSQEQEVAMGLQAAPQMADQFGGFIRIPIFRIWFRRWERGLSNSQSQAPVPTSFPSMS